MHSWLLSHNYVVTTSFTIVNLVYVQYIMHNALYLLCGYLVQTGIDYIETVSCSSTRIVSCSCMYACTKLLFATLDRTQIVCC